MLFFPPHQTNYKKNVYPLPIIPFLLVVTSLQLASDLIIPLKLLWPRWPVVCCINVMDFCQPFLHLIFPWKDPGHHGHHPHHQHHPLLLTSLFSWFQHHHFSLVLLSEFSFLLVLHIHFFLCPSLSVSDSCGSVLSLFSCPVKLFWCFNYHLGIHRSE